MSTAIATVDVVTNLAQRLGSDTGGIIKVYAEALGMKDANPASPHVQGVIKKAAMWGEQWGMIPGIHVGVMPFGEKGDGETTYSLVDKYEYWKACLDIYNRTNGTNCDVRFRQATKAEALEQYKQLFDPGKQKYNKPYKFDDRDLPGCQFATLIDSKKLMDAIGIERMLDLDEGQFVRLINNLFSPMWHFGTYRHCKSMFKDKQGNWQKIAENLPNTETPERRGAMRAAKKAIKFIVPPYRMGDDLTPIAHHLQMVDSGMRESPPASATALIADRKPNFEEDGEMLFATPKGKRNPVVAEEPEDIDFRAVEDEPDEPDEPEEATRLRDSIKALFPESEDVAEKWLIEKYTGDHTPDNVRVAIADLTTEECAIIDKPLREQPELCQNAFSAQVEVA